eukprot:TRINITY_DN2046_c0_g1_i1.p1 TRINITY_DN2046_c0_g1~~TRINITY_DN2046_c0_g1_i1.p1  ORF type:complete len:646 (+),score=80.02 TRINITY_DN2046_c0_g1_i1:54-1991(+)
MNPIEAFRRGKLGKTNSSENGLQSETKDSPTTSRLLHDRELSKSPKIGSVGKATFRLEYTTERGQSVYLSGSQKPLGLWETKNAKRMELENGVWVCHVNELPLHGEIQYKYFLMDPDRAVIWEKGPNRTRTLVNKEGEFTDTWETDIPTLPPPSPPCNIDDDTPSSVTMDSMAFRLKKKPIELAIFLNSIDELVIERDKLMIELERTPPHPSIQEEVDRLLAKVDQFIENHTQHNDNDADKSVKRKNSLRTQARLSHMNLMKSHSQPNVVQSSPLLVEDIPDVLLMLGMDQLQSEQAGDMLQPHNVTQLRTLVQQWTQELKGKQAPLTLAHLRRTVGIGMRQVQWGEGEVGKDGSGDDGGSGSSGSSHRHSVHTYSSQGRRHHMEDRLLFVPHLTPHTPGLFAAVFDGHGGDQAADFARYHLYNEMVRQPSFPNDMGEALRCAFLSTDRLFCGRGDRSGTTATVCVVYMDTLYVANVGDSCAMLVRAHSDALQLTAEHRASHHSEKVRVKEHGGVVVWYQGGWRVNGQLTVSRAIGDTAHKACVISEPQVSQWQLTDEDQFVVMASDGLWDTMSQVQVVEYVRDRYHNRDTNINIANDLAQEALRRNSNDNISVLILFFTPSVPGPRRDKLNCTIQQAHVDKSAP